MFRFFALAIVFALLFTQESLALSDIVSVTIDNPECQDTIDNDGDTFIDFPADPDCSSPTDLFEAGSASGGGGGDTLAPVIADTTPADNSINVSSTTLLTFIFNEIVAPVSGDIRIKESENNTIVETISISSPAVSFSLGRQFDVTLSSPLIEGGAYYVELDSGIVRDSSSNLFSGMYGTTAWNFSVADTGPPLVSDFSLVPDFTSATLSWKTNEPALSAFLWGTSTSYLSGSGVETVYALNHIVVFSPLQASTKYFYKILVRDVLGNTSEVLGEFTTLTQIDSDPPANPSQFLAEPQTPSVFLSWNLPSDLDLSILRIVKSSTGYISDPDSGTILYEGLGTYMYDTSVLINVTYYYTAFARDTSGNWSSGSLASAIIEDQEPIPPPDPKPDPQPGPIPSPGPGGTGVVPLPTPPDVIPATSTPTNVLKRLFFADFIFSEISPAGEKMIPVNDNFVVVNRDIKTRVFLPKEKADERTALVIMTVSRAETKEQSAYILRRTTDNSGFDTLVSFPREGDYGTTFETFDVENKRLQGVSGMIRAKHTLFDFVELPQTIQEIVRRVADPLVTTSPIITPIGIAVGASQSLFLISNVRSFYDIYLMLLKFFGIVTGFFRKRKPVPWGTVYDAVTKQPIDPAYVVVQPVAEGDMRTAITDLDGRYGFLLPPGEYHIIANKTHYKFPSDTLKGRTNDHMYSNLYFGENFVLEEDKIIEYNIPLDPVEFDWNEFVKNKENIFHLYSRKEKFRLYAFNILFFAGFLFSAVAILNNFSTFNMGALMLYVSLYSFQIFWKYQHKVVKVVHSETGLPLSFSVITVTPSGLSVTGKKVVADKLGRFYTLVQPGTYDITIEEKLDNAEYKIVKVLQNIELKKGVIREDIHV